MTDEPSGQQPTDHEPIHYDAVGAEQRTLPTPSVIESIVEEVLGAVPEVREHVLAAAGAMLEAAKTLVDAADRIVRGQRGKPE